MAARNYPIVPLSFLCAIAGSLSCILVCIYVCEHFHGRITENLCIIGCNSIVLYSIQYLDVSIFPYVKAAIGVCFALVIRLMFDLGIFYFIILLKNKYRLSYGRSSYKTFNK